MGMYTALVLDARLTSDTPESVLEILEFMVDAHDDRGLPTFTTPRHDLFLTPRWSWMLNGSSAYFPLERKAQLFKPYYGGWEDIRTLSVGMSIKNYDNEIEKFLDWLAPFVEHGVGFTQYEEDEKLSPFIIEEGVRNDG